MLFNVEFNAVQWTGTEKSTKEALILMGQTVDTKTNVAMGKFEDYCDSVRAKGLLPINPITGYAGINNWIVKCKNGHFIVMDDKDMKALTVNKETN